MKMKPTKRKNLVRALTEPMTKDLVARYLNRPKLSERIRRPGSKHHHRAG
jgi:hypothetical protein